jgi:RNA polymerase sigma-70 factor (ECF subfamily)
MWAYADASVIDIARALELDPNAAHQLLHRAKLTLRSHLEGVTP